MTLAGVVWSIYNVSYILLVSFAPALLVARGLSAEDAGLATSLAGWTLTVSVPVGGVLIERSGRPIAAIIGCVVAMGLAIALVGMAGTSGWIIAATAFIAGLPDGAMMALPALAGLLRDWLDDPRAPLLFAAALCIVTIGGVAAYAFIRASASPEVAR